MASKRRRLSNRHRRVSRADLRRYSRRVEAVNKAAGQEMARLIDAFLKRYPFASVSVARQYAITAGVIVLNKYGDAASELSAQMFEELTGKSAVYDDSDPSAYIAKEARYQAQKLVDGDVKGFSDAMSKCIEDQMGRKANATMRRSCARHGIRYARVPMGGDTCPFCIMLASRGYVYTSAEAAGDESNHYHANCRCKVMPQGADVEGYDPDEYYRQWRELETASSQFGAIDRFDFKRMDAHAERYYEEVRKRGREAVAKRVSENSGMSEADARIAFDHLFIDEHDLWDGRHRFPPDYDMAQSIQRILDGKDVKEHDFLLFPHEAVEAMLEASGMSHDMAHEEAEKMYNYAEGSRLWRRGSGYDA